jgi:hypothetical protein
VGVPEGYGQRLVSQPLLEDLDRRARLDQPGGTGVALGFHSAGQQAVANSCASEVEGGGARSCRTATGQLCFIGHRGDARFESDDAVVHRGDRLGSELKPFASCIVAMETLPSVGSDPKSSCDHSVVSGSDEKVAMRAGLPAWTWAPHGTL